MLCFHERSVYVLGINEERLCRAYSKRVSVSRVRACVLRCVAYSPPTEGVFKSGLGLVSVVVGIGGRTASVLGLDGRGGLLGSAVDLSVRATFVGNGGIPESVVGPCCFGVVRSVKAGFGGIMTSVLGRVLRESGAAVFSSVIIMGGGSRSDFVLLSFPVSIKQVNQFKLDS